MIGAADRWAARVYRWLLLAYPAGFRERYGGDMVQLFEDRLAETRTLGERIAQWGRAVWDSVSQGLSERWLVLLARAADVKDAIRQAWAGEPLRQSGDPLWQRTIRDLRYAARALRRKPAFTVIAVATLALGIGANTAMFSVVNGVLLKPLPFPESDRLVFLTDDTGISVPDVVEWRKESNTLESIGAGTRVWDFDITGDRPPERIVGSTLEAQYFEVLQSRPLLGRVFTKEEDQVGGAWVAVISEAFWQRWFGGDSAVVGRMIILSDNPTTIIGVMPDAFDYLERGTDLWVPVAVATPWAPELRGSGHLHAIGRLKAGVSHEAARTEMEAITAEI
jgi:putative ABC transport system permease protein